jgi:hypothetical protein
VVERAKNTVSRAVLCGRNRQAGALSKHCASRGGVGAVQEAVKIAAVVQAVAVTMDDEAVLAE